MNKQQKQTRQQTHRYAEQIGGYERGSGLGNGQMGEGSQLYGDGLFLCSTCRCQIIMSYTWNLYMLYTNKNKYNYNLYLTVKFHSEEWNSVVSYELYFYLLILLPFNLLSNIKLIPFLLKNISREAVSIF